MNDEMKEEINQDDTANTSKEAEELVPLEVKVVPEKKKEEPNINYESADITDAEIEEFENDSQ